MESKCERCKLCKPSCTSRWNDDIVCDECFLGEPISPNHVVKETQDDLLSSSIWDDNAMTDTANLSVDLMINKQKPKDKDEKDPAINTHINQLQKQVKEEFKVESLVSWEKILQLN